ncbi:cutinase transcription factor 1 beta [Fusarium longipes]|uniref:Cutinase transcription factor 1 beta n=1 Tax=Fusarium longipes TaxID=694270 RepID=A0A395SYU5_9HYPO|nr:cutinase transcription factor 1 beta [Fusarium longipes]
MPSREKSFLLISAQYQRNSAPTNSPVSSESHLPRRPQPDLLYLNILQDTVDNTANGQSNGDDVLPNDEVHNSFNTQLRRWNPPLQLDDIDNEYLVKKGVFKLPSFQQMRPCDEASRKLYRRIWWILHNRDIFHFFVNTQNLRLLVTAPPIESLTKNDWEDEDIEKMSDFLSPTNHQQKASLIAHCELAQICGEVYLLEALTTSYRFECILCRLLRRGRWGIRSEEVRKWAYGRFRAAILELETILKKVLVSDIIRQMPTTFITTITALLALHIESALDSSESDITQSMARISIQYTMLAINQIQDLPAIKRALPAFEMVLTKKRLYPPSISDVVHIESPEAEGDVGSDQFSFLGVDFSGFEFFDRWQMEQLEFTGIY